MKEILQAFRIGPVLSHHEMFEFQDELKTIDEKDLEKLISEIIETGFAFPPYVWKDPSDHLWQIVDALQRKKALIIIEERGYTVPRLQTIEVLAKDPQQAKRRVLQATSQYGRMTAEGLVSFAKSAGIKFEGLGNFRFPDIKNMSVVGTHLRGPAETTEDDVLPEPPQVPKTTRGELWVLGRHRLLIDDCSTRENLVRLMGGELAGMVFTDPPYGMHLDTSYSSMNRATKGERFVKGMTRGKDYAPVHGDDQPFDPAHIFDFFSACPEIFLWGADYYAERIPDRLKGSWIVWDKRKTEELDRMFGSAFELCWSRRPHKRDIARVTWAGIFGMGPSEGGRVHPTQKPVRLVEWFLERWGAGVDLVVDLYLGSGTTLMACEKTARRCFGCEITPAYGDVILDRWATVTGLDPVREADGVAWSSLKSR